MSQATEKKDVQVCLVMPPVSYSTGPSLGLGLLKAALLRDNISCIVDYADVHFNYALGVENLFHVVTGEMSDFLGEYIFNVPAGIDSEWGDDGICKHFAAKNEGVPLLDAMRIMKKAKELAISQTEETAERILAHHPKVVGVYSSFQQRNAAVAILRKVKELDPQVITAMGGANCSGPAGLALLEEFPFIDYVFFGECDDIFADVIRRGIEESDRKRAAGAAANAANAVNTGEDVPVKAANTVADVPVKAADEADAANAPEWDLPYGVLKQGSPRPSRAPHRIVMNLDELPYPDFDDFFELYAGEVGMAVRDLLSHASSKENNISLYLEASRGCWWGQKKPCTFCGLNGVIHTYRKKSDKRFLEELQTLTEKYGVYTVNLTDMTMPASWPRDMFPLLKALPAKYNLFTELRTNLRPDQIREMAEAGLIRCQPGIESLSNHVLKLMNKGTTCLDNLVFLKNSRKYGISLAWNILTGFPGEVLSDYTWQIKLIPLIEHFGPPNCAAPIIFTRETEYAKNPEKYGLKLAPKSYYRFQCPQDSNYVEGIAIYYGLLNNYQSEELRDAAGELNRMCVDWMRRWNRQGGSIRLEGAQISEGYLVIDTRSCSPIRAQLLSETEADLCIICDNPCDIETIREKMAQRRREQGRPDCTDSELADGLRTMMNKNLMLKIGKYFLCLVIPITRDALIQAEVRDFRYLYEHSSRLRQQLQNEISEQASSGKALGIAAKEAITACARRINMYFTGDDYAVCD